MSSFSLCRQKLKLKEAADLCVLGSAEYSEQVIEATWCDAEVLHLCDPKLQPGELFSKLCFSPVPRYSRAGGERSAVPPGPWCTGSGWDKE